MDSAQEEYIWHGMVITWPSPPFTTSLSAASPSSPHRVIIYCVRALAGGKKKYTLGQHRQGSSWRRASHYSCSCSTRTPRQATWSHTTTATALVTSPLPQATENVAQRCRNPPQENESKIKQCHITARLGTCNAFQWFPIQVILTLSPPPHTTLPSIKLSSFFYFL